MTDAAAEVGRRVRARREALGLSQGELARRLGRTQTAVSYWEAGKRTPAVEDLLDIAAALDIDVARLMPAPARRPVGAVLRAVGEEIHHPAVADALERFAAQAAAEPTPPVEYSVSAASARDAADELLAQAGISKAPVNVAVLARGCGARVLEWDFQRMVDGLVVMLSDGAAIGLEQDQSPQRARFTLAHELGHFLLRHSATFHVDYHDVGGTHGDAPGYNWRHERAANEFAANILMPANLVRRAYAPSVPVPQLAQQFNVSAQAMAFRLAALGLRPVPDR